MIKHTILLEENVWSISGIYFDEHEIIMPIEGSLETRIENNCIKFRSTINFGKQNSSKLLIVSDIKRTNIANTFEMKCTITNIGDLEGRIMISDENLVMILESQDKVFAGSEYFKKISDDFYKNRGIIYKGNQKFSSWSYEIRRK